jgi:predicted MFS family arabinose efflux permease
MLICEAIRTVALATLALAVLLGGATLVLIMSIALVEAAAGVLFESAQSGVLRHVVPREQLGAALAANEARMHGVAFAGPPIGGLLFGIGRFVPFLVDAITYAVSFSAISRVRSRLQDDRTSASPPLLPAIREGWNFVINEPFLRALATISPLVNAGNTGILFVIVIVLNEQKVPAAAIGIILSAAGVGGLLGALATPWLQRHVSAPVLVISAFCAAAVAACSVAALSGTYLVALPLCLMLLFGPAANATLGAYQIAITRDELQGRVESVIMLLATCLVPFAPALGGIVAEQAGGRVALWAFAALLVIAAIFAALSRGIRSIPSLTQAAASS